MKRLLPLALVMINAVASAQYVLPNPSFDFWSTSILWSNPDQYQTSNLQSYLNYSVATVVKSPAAHGGLFCAMLRTEQEALGMISFGIPGNEGFLDPLPFTGIPDSIVFWANYDIADGDLATFVVMLQLNGVMVGNTYITLTSSSNGYVRISSAIIYLTDDMPNELGFTAFNTSSDNPQPSSILFLDDIEFIYSAQEGQSFPNGDFESWTDQSIDIPDGWHSSNEFIIDNPSVSPSPDAVSGLSARIESVPIPFSKGDNFGFIILEELDSQNCGDGTMVLNGIDIPIGINGMYKYLPAVESNDSASVYLGYEFYDSANDSCGYRLEWLEKLPEASEWTSFSVSIPFEIYSQWCFSPQFPDYFAVGFVSTIVYIDAENQPTGPQGSVLFIDELNLIEDTCWPVLEQDKLAFEIFPNPASDKLRLSNLSSNGVNEIALFNALGQLMSSFKCNGSNKEIDISNFPEGQYFVRVSNDVEFAGKAFLKSN